MVITHSIGGATSNETVQTVLGAVPVESLKYILPHEHLPYTRTEVGAGHDMKHYPRILSHVKPMIQGLLDHGCNTIVECTPAASGRDVAVLARLSEDTGVHIICCTGYYTKSGRPTDFDERSPTELAGEMIKELTEGIDGTDIRAGVIKIGASGLGAGDRLLCKAAAIAQQETGASITTHTCSPSIRRGVLDMLDRAGVCPERICLGHADDNASLVESLDLLRCGCNVLYTIWGIQNTKSIGWGLPVLPKYHSAGLLAGVVAEGNADQVMMSIDYSAGIVDGEIKEDLYDIKERNSLYMFTHVIPILKNVFGLGSEVLDTILSENPRRMLVWRK